MEKTKESRRPVKTTNSRTTKLASGQGLSDDLIVVGFGASAGGLEALSQVLPGLSSEVNMTYVIVQHLDPKHRSLMASLLNRHSKMEVREIEDGQKVEPGKIYIVPPGKNVILNKGALELSMRTAAIGPTPSVDHFFTSLAEEIGDRAVGIILSGTGSDGAHGIRAIKASGGFTIVQEEKTAKYNGMPHAAIETGHVDLILPPAKIGQELLAVIKYPHLVPSVPPDEKPTAAIDKIFNLLEQRTRADFSNYKLTTINRRIGRRMALHKLGRLSDYIRYLEQMPTELDLLFNDILISVTSFFRDPDAFRILADVITSIVESKNPGDNIRVWVPGCATGEEAHSIAMLFAEKLKSDISKNNIQIFATDLDQEAIVAGRKGLYPAATVKDVDKALLDRYFTQEDNMVQVTKPIREMIVFAKQDLTKDPPFSHLDLISCRNLLIYFNTRLQKKIVPLFHYVLNPGGVLFLGKSESIGQFADLFTTINKKMKIFRRKGTFRSQMVDFTLSRRARHLNYGAAQTAPLEKEPSLKQIVGETILDAHKRSCVLIDDRQEVVYVHGDVNAYLTLPPGEIGLNILNLARRELRLDLRTLIHKSVRENKFVRSNRIKIPTNGQERSVILHAGPASSVGHTSGMTLVMIEEIATGQGEVHPETDLTQCEDPRLAELEHELASTRQHLQTTVEELETSNEELQSLNEELQSANEELQSSNEELETSNEELQSTNEELTTVNEELQVKSAELADANADLENILKSVGTAMIILDIDLRVTKFTPPAVELFRLKSSDIGQIITSIPSKLTLPDFRQTLLDVLSTGTVKENDISVNAKSYRMRVLPYVADKDRPVGVMLVFQDRSEICEAEKKLVQQRPLLDAIDGQACIINRDKIILSINSSFSATYGPESEILGRHCFEVAHGSSSICEGPQRVCPFQEALETGRATHAEHIVSTSEVEKKKMGISISPLINTQGKIEKFLHICRPLEDIKELK